MTLITEEKQIAEYQLRTLRKALELEGMGIKFKGQSRLSFAKKHLGYKGTRKEIISQISVDIYNTLQS